MDINISSRGDSQSLDLDLQNNTHCNNEKEIRYPSSFPILQSFNTQETQRYTQNFTEDSEEIREIESEPESDGKIVSLSTVSSSNSTISSYSNLKSNSVSSLSSNTSNNNSHSNNTNNKYNIPETPITLTNLSINNNSNSSLSANSSIENIKTPTESSSEPTRTFSNKSIKTIEIESIIPINNFNNINLISNITTNSDSQKPPPQLLFRNPSSLTNKKNLQIRRRNNFLSLSIPESSNEFKEKDELSIKSATVLSNNNKNLYNELNIHDKEPELILKQEQIKFYFNGPKNVLNNNLYLYSEPNFNDLKNYDIVINVAKEIKDFTNEINEFNESNNISNNNENNNIEYFFVPWTHSSKINEDLPKLIKIINDSISRDLKILVHCQCGISRSASLILAFFMVYFKIDYFESYNLLKLKIPTISPNLSLIYELIEFGKKLGLNKYNDVDGDVDGDDERELDKDEGNDMDNDKNQVTGNGNQ
ncbi:hypothetical protein BVG19_g4837 [[Candida] boidinii]|nr:hypothetical protein BVG19_g4837 [[Candida] boidinii]OWB51266.1 hypothetical protein B5S27_g2826 [[Candida] boidinii]